MADEGTVREQAETLLGEPALAASSFRPVRLWDYPSLAGTARLIKLALTREWDIQRIPKPLYLVVTQSELVVFGFNFGVVTTLKGPAARWPRTAITGVGATDRYEFEMSVKLGSKWLNLRAPHGDEGAQAVYAALRRGG